MLWRYVSETALADPEPSVMLPVLRVQSLIRVADDQYTSQALKHREKMRDSQSDRDLAGFYVYQSYLKRLRRLHRNYVKKYRAMQQQPQRQQQKDYRGGPSQQNAKSLLFLPNCHLKTEFSHTISPTNLSAQGKNDDWTATRYRLQLDQSQELMLEHGKNFDQSQTTSNNHTMFPPIANKRVPPITSINETTEDEGENDGDLGSKEKPIYIPCGRENSAIRLQKLKKKKQQERDRSGALSFRMWRSVHGLTGTPYST